MDRSLLEETVLSRDQSKAIQLGKLISNLVQIRIDFVLGIVS
jgi:hypothetical protein